MLCLALGAMGAGAAYFLLGNSDAIDVINEDRDRTHPSAVESSVGGVQGADAQRATERSGTTGENAVPGHSTKNASAENLRAEIALGQNEKGFRLSQLEALILDGKQLHNTLRNRPMDDTVRHLPAGMTMPSNPYVSTDAEFVRAIAGASSQGRLRENGIRAVLYSLYIDEKELGFYGLEAMTLQDANQREAQLREVWSVNASFNRARVHREGVVVLVIWTDGVSEDCWKAVNETVSDRLKSLQANWSPVKTKS